MIFDELILVQQMLEWKSALSSPQTIRKARRMAHQEDDLHPELFVQPCCREERNGILNERPTAGPSMICVTSNLIASAQYVPQGGVSSPSGTLNTRPRIVGEPDRLLNAAAGFCRIPRKIGIPLVEDVAARPGSVRRIKGLMDVPDATGKAKHPPCPRRPTPVSSRDEYRSHLGQ
jgi:hypothetical protein